MRIKTLSLTDFRAFPGPAPTTFELDGKNLLVYGENGSGKSSLFHALRGFFSPTSPPDLRTLKNSFSKVSLEHLSVKVAFDDGTFERWGMALQTTRRSTTGEMVGPFIELLHPAHRASGPSTAVRSAAQMASCLDYRSLLATNYKHENGPVNLFEPVVGTLLADYLDFGTNKTIGQLWRLVQEAVPTRNTRRQIGICLQACTTFNTALRTALSRLLIDLNQLLPRLSASGVRVEGFEFSGVTYLGQITDLKMIGTKQIGLTLTYQGVTIDRPQNYLNEARLSALGLALYLAGRLASVPQTVAGLKLLVLDDVLIGLDQTNRIPVLDLLDSQFKDWQVILLTHDRLWFETARARAGLSGGWNIVELFANSEADSAYRPTVAVRESDVVEDYLQRASVHLGNSDWRASAVYARSAFEMWLKVQCAAHSIPIQFSLEPRKIDANVYFNAIEKWADNSQAKPAFAGVLKVLALYRDTVFNPGSHSYPTTMSGGEQRAAIAAMRFVNGATKHGTSALQLAAYLIAKPNASPEELALAAGFLRVAFMRRLRELARQKSLALPFTMEPREIGPTEFWAAMCTAGWPVKRNSWVAGINANSVVLLSAWTWPVLLGLNVGQLQAAMQAVKQH
ncbi:MAG: AAA family ATPase [Acidovorax defluvii]